MFIKIPASGHATLEDQDNFKAFKIIAAPNATSTEVGRHDDAHVWVDQAWLKSSGRANDPAWLENLNKMLKHAAGAGWLDETGAVRAHVEYA